MSKKNRIITVQGTEITVLSINNQDYISLTDMVKGFDGARSQVSNWMRSRGTLDFLGTWERIHNATFNYLEFEVIKKDSGSNTFFLSPKKWIEKTSAVGIISKTGRYGGTFAHQDIAYEFGTWLNAEFKIYLIKEFRRLKEWETGQNKLQWDHRRFLSKISYRLQTDAIQRNVIPLTSLPEDKHGIIYAEEADLLNVALFGITSKQWKDQNASKVLNGYNIRDDATVAQLIVLNNLEQMNALMLENKISQPIRLKKLRRIAVLQLKTYENDYRIVRLEDGHPKILDGSNIASE